MRTLRDLGVDLPTIRRVVDRELPLPEVAATHAEALAVQIRVLTLRHAVLTAVAERGLTAQETDLLHKLTHLSEDERRRLIGDFLDAAFGSLDTDSALAGIWRSMTPEIPDSPQAEQVRAWVEWAELAADPDFRASVRRMSEDHAAEQAQGDTTGPHRDLGAVVRDRVGSPGWSGFPGTRCWCRERHNPPAGLPRLGPAPGLADDEQTGVVPTAERAGEGAAIQVDSSEHLT